MTDFFVVMLKPFLACLILTGIHAYLGFHVIKREIIFVDLSLAQIAALGAVLALLAGFEAHSMPAYWLSLAATLCGAVILSLTRTKRQSLPQEVIIGIIYVISAALSILLLHHSPEGDEHIRHMLVGNILLVDSHNIIKMFSVYILVGIFHYVYRKQFFAVSSADANQLKGVNIKKWDLLFYISFGLVVTSSVEVAGVLLVFSFLIIPAAMALLLTQSIRLRLIWGWCLGAVFSMIGLAASYFMDLPTGASIVCSFGLGLGFISLFRRRYQ